MVHIIRQRTTPRTTTYSGTLCFFRQLLKIALQVIYEILTSSIFCQFKIALLKKKHISLPIGRNIKKSDIVVYQKVGCKTTISECSFTPKNEHFVDFRVDFAALFFGVSQILNLFLDFL